MAEERIQKILSKAGLGARRKCEALITEGRVTVNGVTVSALGSKADPETEEIAVDGKRVKTVSSNARHIIMFNKPEKCITSASDSRGRPLVMDYFKDYPVRLFPVGRLDFDTEGLLLLTNDGNYAQEITHPKHKVFKTYEAVVAGIPSEETLEKLRVGIMLEDGPTAPAIVRSTGITRDRQRTTRRRDKPLPEVDAAVIHISIREGRKRQVRRMFLAVGHRVIRLRRIAIGKLKLGELKIGKWKVLTEREAELAKQTD
ncbi:MAG TPA: pseudouridine synthase [bacterium]|nr:pseudouridine synthase [bacterium]